MRMLILYDERMPSSTEGIQESMHEGNGGRPAGELSDWIPITPRNKSQEKEINRRI